MKMQKYRNSLRKLIRKVRMFITNRKVRKEIENQVAFLSNRKLEGNLASSPTFFFQNHSIKTVRKPFSQKKICKFCFNYSCAVSQNKNMH